MDGSKADLLQIMSIINNYALTDPSYGGPKSDQEYVSISRLSFKLMVALNMMGVRAREIRHPLSSGVLVLYHADPGSKIDVKA
jgi:hypothetical protein